MADDRKGSELSLSTVLNNDDKFLIIVPDNSSSTGYDNRILKWSTIKSQIESIATQKAKDEVENIDIPTGGGTSGNTGGTSIALPLDFSDASKITMENVGAILNSTDTDNILLIREDGSIKKVNATVFKTDNVTTEYITLDEEVGETYRITVGNDGNLKVIKNSAYTVTPPTPAHMTNFHGLIISSMYGAGATITGAPVSHNFIELYNNKNVELNLEGLHLWYKDTTTYTEWTGLPLHGTIKPYSSYLVVGGQCANEWDTDCRHYIKDYDQRWMAEGTGLGMKFSDNGFSVYLSVTGDTPPASPDAYSKNPDGSYTTNKIDNFIDLMGGGGLTSAPPAFNLYFRSGMTNKKGLRKIDFYNRFQVKDFSNYIATEWCADDWRMTEVVDYTSCHEGKFPKSSKDGHWNMFENYKDMFNDEGINYFNMAIGETLDTRCFCFQMKASRDDAFVWYRKKGEDTWNVKQCNIFKWRHPNMDVNICKAIVKDLELGQTYEYQVGTEGIKSGVHEFVAFNKDFSAGDTVRILWTNVCPYVKKLA